MGQPAKKIEKPELLTTSEIGRRLKLHRQTVAARLDDLNYEPDPSSNATNNKLYLFTDALKFDILAAKDQSSAMKIRDLRATAELKEFKLAEAKREYVPMHETVDISQKLVSALYKEFAVHQPKRLAARIVKCKTASEVVKMMKADTEKFMVKLRGNFQVSDPGPGLVSHRVLGSDKCTERPDTTELISFGPRKIV